MTILKTLSEYINLHFESEYITRKSLTKLGLPMATVDNYRRMLTGAGYLEHTGLGLYKGIKLIPEDFTPTQMRKEYKASLDRIKYRIKWYE